MYPRQAIATERIQSRFRLALEPQRDDMVIVVVPLGVDHVIHFVTVGANPGVGLAALHQTDRTGIGLALNAQAHASRLEHLTQNVPGQTAAIGVAVIAPELAYEVDIL